jgi:hypothetical protein
MLGSHSASPSIIDKNAKKGGDYSKDVGGDEPRLTETNVSSERQSRSHT